MCFSLSEGSAVMPVCQSSLCLTFLRMRSLVTIGMNSQRDAHLIRTLDFLLVVEAHGTVCNKP